MPTKKMSAQWVETIKPPTSGREEWFDTQVRGLGLRVSETGKKAWFVHFRLRGDRTKRRLTLEPYPVLTLADARERAKEALLEAARGNDPTVEKREDKAALTFEALAKEYIERYAKVHKKSWYEDQRNINNDLLPAWKRRKAKDIKRKDVIELLDSIKDRGAPILANRVLGLVRKMFNWAISRDLLEINPCNQVKPVAPAVQSERVLTNEEIRQVWSAFNQLDQLMGTLFKLCLVTAQRRGEVRTMRWTDVDLDEGWWTIPSERSKNALSHRVPLSPLAVQLVKAMKPLTGSQEWVFASTLKPGRPITEVFKPKEKVRSLSGVTFVLHDLRRTAASHMTSLGISRLVVGKILNHVETGVTRVYDRHSYDAEKRQALDTWARHLEALTSPKIANGPADG